MCLFKTHRFPKISRKPIKCYKKVLLQGGNRYETEIKSYPFKLGDTIKSVRCWIYGIFCKRLYGEVVHAYLFVTIDSMNEYNRNSGWGKFIECEIPPFTPYWIGKYENIGAAKIKTIKEV